MKLTLGLLFLPLLCGQVVTPTFPPTPASLSVFAGAGDLTYCVCTPAKGTVPSFTLTCRRSGATFLTLTILRSSGVFSNGDIVWIFRWDDVNPRLVHVQAAANTRDPAVLSAWLNFGTVTGEFTIGESVHDAGNSKGGTVSHWVHTTGTVQNDGAATVQYGAQLTLNNLVGTWAVGDQVIGAAGSGTIGAISPVTSNGLKTAFDVEWPASSPSFFTRMLRAITFR